MTDQTQTETEQPTRTPILIDTTNATAEQLEKIVQDFLPIEWLGKFGFDDEIIGAMVEFEIFPQVVFFSDDPDKVPHVRAADIFGRVVNQLLHNEMDLYRAVGKKTATLEKLRAEIEAGAVPLTSDDLERAATTEGGLAAVIAEKLARKENPDG